MEPKSLSASAVTSFEGCEARYKAEYLDKVPDLQGSAAGLGSACHGALEDLVANGYHVSPDGWEALKVYYATHYYEYFSDTSRYNEGVEMLQKWWDRHGLDYWNGRVVLSTEVKETFDLKFTVEDNEIVVPFTYIWDRCDSLKGGDEIEVVDYKSVIMPVSNDELRHRIQVRSYALAAQIKYPNAKRIWVTFDLLRYDNVGVAFSRDENIATWRYLQELGKRVWASDGILETLNPECRWCVRKPVCSELERHIQGGGMLGVQDLDAAVDSRARMEWAVAAIRNQMANLDDFILEHMEQKNILEYRTDKVEVKATMRNTRTVDREDEILAMLPHEIAAKYGSIGVTALDKILKDEPIGDDLKSKIRQMIRRTPGKVTLKSKSLTALDEEN